MIVKTPSGEAPEWVRKAWLVMALPCIGKFPPHGTIGVLSKDPVHENKDVFCVPQKAALAILAETQPEAVAWWDRRGFPTDNRCFTFCEDEVMVLSGDQGQDAWG